MAQYPEDLQTDLLAFEESRVNDDSQVNRNNSVLLRGLPIVDHDRRPILSKHLVRRIGEHGELKPCADLIYMPMDSSGTSKGYGFCELVSAEAATAVVTNMHGHILDMRHTLTVERLVDCVAVHARSP